MNNQDINYLYMAIIKSLLTQAQDLESREYDSFPSYQDGKNQAKTLRTVADALKTARLKCTDPA